MKKTVILSLIPALALLLIAAGTQKNGTVTTSQATREYLTNETAAGWRAALGIVGEDGDVAVVTNNQFLPGVPTTTNGNFVGSFTGNLTGAADSANGATIATNLTPALTNQIRADTTNAANTRISALVPGWISASNAIDIPAQLTRGTNIVVAANFIGNGNGLTNLNTTNLTGTLTNPIYTPTGYVGTLVVSNFAGNGSGLTNNSGSSFAPSNNPTLYGAVRINMPSGTYGANSDGITIGGNGTNSMDVFGAGGRWRELFATGGKVMIDQVSGKEILNFTTTVAPNQPSGYTALGGTTIPAGSTGYDKQQVGAGYTAWLNVIGGDGSALRSLPMRGPEIWNSLKYPMPHVTTWYDGGGQYTVWAVTNITAASVTNAIEINMTNGFYRGMTNFGLTPWVQIDIGWARSNRTAAGLLIVNSNQFPTGIEGIGQYIHSKGWKYSLHIYFESTPTNNWMSDPIGHAFSTTYPNSAAMTPFTINSDIKQFYDWGEHGPDGIRYANMNPRFDTAGYQNQAMRLLADAIVNPNGFPWQRNYTRQLVLSALMGDNNLRGFSESALLAVNEVQADSEIVSVKAARNQVSDVLTNAQYIYNTTARLSGKGRYITAHNVGDPGVPSAYSNYHWRAEVSLGAMWGSSLQVNSSNSPAEIADITNQLVMQIYFDSESHPAWQHAKVGDSQSAYIKPLKDGGYAVWMLNDSATNHTFTFNQATCYLPPLDWSPLQRPPVPPKNTTVYKWMDAFNRTNIGFFDNHKTTTISYTVEPTNTVLVLVKPVWHRDFKFSEIPMGYSQVHYSGDAIGDTGIFDGMSGARWASSPQSTFTISDLPNATTNIIFTCKYYAGATYSMWTNTISPQYRGGTTRFWNSGGVSQSSQTVIGSSADVSNLTMTCTLPVTNATKWVVFYNEAATNSASRFYLDPARIIAEQSEP